MKHEFDGNALYFQMIFNELQENLAISNSNDSNKDYHWFPSELFQHFYHGSLLMLVVGQVTFHHFYLKHLP